MASRLINHEDNFFLFVIAGPFEITSFSRYRNTDNLAVMEEMRNVW
jgi:hypothetical protein